MTIRRSTLPARATDDRTGSSAARPGSTTTRRGLLRWGALAGTGTLLTACAGGGQAPGTGAPPERPEVIDDPDQALELLREGNARFVTAHEQHTTGTLQRRVHVAAAQHPFAIVLSCADSRVPPELVFDRGLGDLFVVRTAGQVLAPPVLGSIQYGVEHLHVPLVVVLGHENCGAVGATLDAVQHHSPASGTAVDSLVEAIRPAVERARASTGGTDGTGGTDLLARAVRANVAAEVSALAADPLLAAAVDDGHLRIVGATYDLDDGNVTFTSALAPGRAA
ncbi:carbonic anhydrase [Kineococcus sp. SYSU DK002]|uniref:carbonic anhydrase n=1 Tax=Kineococcus sp. SYSU DK002 TaxID=3383123 RepID=UPI003D7CC62F